MCTIIHSVRLHGFLWLALCIAAIVTAIPWEAQAQPIRDSRGTEFWITFLPNFHNDPAEREDSLYIFITAEQPTSGRIEYYDRNGQNYTRTFSINKDEFFIFSTVFDGFELEGVTSPSGSNPSPQNEQPAPQVFRITADREVTVYGLNQARTTSDAFIALPVDVLGQDYYVVSYPADQTSNSPTPSEFAVVATADNTTIMITPSVRTSTGSSDPQLIELNRGEAYLVQTPTGTTLDLTGTKIEADKPVAVFAGHQRARVSQSTESQSRDHLVEQLPPIPAWGGSAFVTPYPLATNAEPSNFDKYRVLAAFDDTDIYVDGLFSRTLGAGEYYDAVLNKAEWITATGPILVTQYKKTSQRISSPGANDYTGDPFMIVNSPVEQYLNRYHCFSVKAWEGFQEDIYGAEQYITIIAPTDSVGTVRLNGAPVPASAFRPLSITSYSYTERLRVNTGINTIEANVGVGVYVYGYGFANSYGYIGGMKYDSIYTFDPPDIIPPLLLGTPVCDSLVGGAYDTLAFDLGIRTLGISGESNVSVDVDSITPPARSVGFRARLVDPYRDGSFTVTTRDSAGGGRTQEFRIPGFTVRMASAVDGEPPVSSIGRLRLNSVTCATISLVNDGEFSQTISHADLGAFPFSTSPPLPVVIPPGGTRTLTVCMTTATAGAILDTFRLGNNCLRRPVVVFDAQVAAPLTGATTLDCNELEGRFLDTAVVRIGVDRLEPLPASIDNIAVQVDPVTPGDDTLRFRASLVNPYEDGRATVTAISNNENWGEIDIVIPGFTVHADPVTRTPVVLEDETRVRKQYCLPVELTNYGGFERTVDAMRFRNNSAEFTVQPPSVTIPPGGTAIVDVCFYSEDLGVYTDTLIIGNDCTERAVAAVTINALKDTLRPSISRVVDSCATFDRIVVTDSLKLDWGIASVAVPEQVNCVVQVDSSSLPGFVALDVQPIDRRRDALYRVVVADSAGNMRDTTFILQGFTISFPGIQSAGGYSFGTTTLVRCDSIAVYNSSSLPFEIDRLSITDNTRFSAPLSQFPIVVPPRDTGYVVLCFEPQRERSDTDTLLIAHNCIEEIIALKGDGGAVIFTADTRCDVSVTLSSSSTPPEAFIAQNFPNPAAETTTLRFGVNRKAPVRITLYNALGNRVAELVHTTFEAGIYDVEVDLGTLESGLYFYEFTALGSRSVEAMSIVR